MRRSGNSWRGAECGDEEVTVLACDVIPPRPVWTSTSLPAAGVPLVRRVVSQAAVSFLDVTRT
jgi:hypothetical protein